MSAKHRRVNGAEMIAEEMARAALRNEAIPAELKLGKSWKHFDVHEHQYEDDDSRMYIFEILIPVAPSVVQVVCNLSRWYDSNYRTWGWLTHLCEVNLTNDRSKVWKFSCTIRDDEIMAFPTKD